MNRLKVSSLGPIKEADITFGDLTIMVGPQASGKSILLQMLKLIYDRKSILGKLVQNGFTLGNTGADILNRYFGEGMSGIWKSETEVEFNSKKVPLNSLLSREKDLPFDVYNPQNYFYIPAQRIICLQNGWPRNFNDYEDSVPFVLRNFSETIRLFTERNLNINNTGFSKAQGLNEQVRQSFDDTIFHQSKIAVDTTTVKKRFKLEIGNSSIPFMVWSAGQKEFMPLLLSFYYLCSEDNPKRHSFTENVILEEPEMGLHPQAIKSVLLQILDLMHRGYNVILSTHSPVILEFVWALTNLQKNDSSYIELAELFELNNITDDLKTILEKALKSTIKTYFFDRKEDGVIVRDISSLDAGSEDEAIAEWGGLTSFSSKAVDIVSNAVSHD